MTDPSRDRAPAVSIITPTRNRADLLKETVASVQDQDFDSWEMVIVDDASEDDTWSWLCARDDPRIVARRLQTHRERSAARNFGLEVSRGRYVMFLDDDDLLPRTAITTHLLEFDRRPDIVASVGARVMFDHEGREVVERAVHERMIADVWREVVFGWVSVAGATMFDTRVLQEVGGWSESLVIAEDYELWTRIARRGPVAFLPDVVLRYRVHDGQWRSADFMGLMEEIRRSAVASTTGKLRLEGESALAARSGVVNAREFSATDRHARAALELLRARRAAPGLLGSPLVAAVPDAEPPSLGRSVVKAAVPNPLLRLMRREQGDEVGSSSVASFSVTIRDDEDGRFDPPGDAPAQSDTKARTGERLVGEGER